MEDKPDGLEIVSIGKLYTGPWDKKYWSSSRGKDRYPYPVGYKALRNLNGVTYKMEILEDFKGPLFMISSTDGQSSSGQTPDIAWECFQKKGCPRIKSLPGKRFSCKIDGVEVFGFKNAFVQRLLRELVADVNETTDKLPSTSNFTNSVALETNYQSQCTVYPNLPLHLKKPQTGKRSRREKIMNVNLNSNTSLKKLRRQNKKYNSDASHSAGKSHEPSSPKVLPGSMRSEAIVQEEENQVTEEDVSSLVPLNTNDHPKEHGLFSKDENKCSSFGIQPPLEEVAILPKDGKPFDRLEVSKLEVCSNPFIEEKNEETLVTNDLHLANDASLYVHDTLDNSTADTFNLTSTNMKDEISAPDMVTPDLVRTDSHIEEELGISSSNVSSAKSEFESFDQEIAKSMMTVLLPRALPLLKTFSRRKKNSVLPPEQSPHLSQEENKTDLHVSVTCVSKLTENSDLEMKKEQTECPDGDHDSVLPCSGHIESIIPDSLDNDEGGYVPDTELPLSCEMVEAVQSSPERKTKTLPDIVDSEKNSLVCHDFQMDLCNNSKEDTSDTSMACKKAYVSASTEKNTNTINKCGAVSSETLTVAEPMLECVPLSESIMCKEFRNDCAAEAYAKVNPSNVVHLSEVNGHGHSLLERTLSGNEPKIDSSLLCPLIEDRVASTDGVLHDVAPSLQNQENSRLLGGSHNSDAHRTNSCQEISKFDAIKEHLGDQNFVTHSLSYMQNQRMDTYEGMNEKKHDNDDSNFTTCMDIENNKSELKGIFKLVACYVHPMPVSMVLVTTVEKEIILCVLCGPFLQKERKLFIYKAPMTGEDEGHPSFVGYTSLMLPFGRDIELDSSALQFSPHGQYLVLLNSIKAPCCREGDINCPCLACALDLEDNAVKILQIKGGYASVIARLQSTKSVRCILVCRPHHLIAADDSGKLYIWVMNSKWSKKTEECFVQSPSCMLPLIDLKRIPNFLHLVLGLDEFGEFSLWDINKRVLVSKFSSPHTSVFQCLPLSLFTWQAKCNILSDLNAEDALNEIMDATKASFSVKGDNQVVSYFEGDEVVVWLLVSTAPDPDQHVYQSSEHTDLLRCWRLALLVKNSIIMGDVLEPRAAVAGASVGRGVMGRSDGLVYMWDLITGIKLGSLHHFKDGSVSSIGTDDSQSGALAIASDGGQLLLYLPNSHPNKR